MRRTVEHSLIKALRNVPGFDLLSDDELLAIAGASVNLFWRAESTVFEKDSPGEALYIVLSGRVRIYDVVDGEEIEIAETKPGDFFGEMALLLETTHTKNAQALDDSVILVLMKERFARLLDGNPELARHLRDTLEERRTATAGKYQTERPA